MTGEEETFPILRNDEVQESEQSENEKGSRVYAPVYWFKGLVEELHWSFLFAVIIVYVIGMNEGLGLCLEKVVTEYYLKDVRKVQPSEAQYITGTNTRIPWFIKPLWGLFTDFSSETLFRHC